MNIFIEKHQQLIKELLEANVDFILIGGSFDCFKNHHRQV